MNCICEFLYDILPTTSSKVQAWAAVITTGLGGYAIISWKHQKYYDIYTNSLGILKKSSPFIFQHFTEVSKILSKNSLSMDEIIGELVNESKTKSNNLFETSFYLSQELVKELPISNIKYKKLRDLFAFITDALYRIEKCIIRVQTNQELPENKNKLLYEVKDEIFKISLEYLETVNLFFNPTTPNKAD